jgi:omega-amidase
MRISLVQPDTVWENKTGNFRKIDSLISPLYNETDIVILPEMFNTGFSMDPARLGEIAGNETFSWMTDMAAKGNFGLCGSFIVSENDRYFNRFVFVSPEKEIWHYDKRHLFRMAGEHKYFSPGNKRVVFSFRGVRICPLVCYDLRFPVWSRNRNDTDLIIYSANWPEARKSAWISLIKARAIENQCFVAGVNRVGNDGKGILYCGESMLINYLGEVITNAGASRETSVTGEIRMDELSEFRSKFPFLSDADDFIVTV